MFNLFGYAPPTEYVPCQGLPFLSDIDSGYLSVQYIDQSEATMLSEVWEEKQHGNNVRVNLFKGLAQILLDFAKVPVPQIGSFIIDDNGFLVLCNRPLSNEIPLLESRNIPVDIPRDITYSTVDSYVADILTYHDSRLQRQPNAVHDSLDGITQVTALATMRSVVFHFFERDLRRGPFLYTLNDLHGSNILVDKDLNIQYIIDLEWACSQPIEMIHLPHWFAGQWVDTMDVDLYATRHEEFVGILEDMERESPTHNNSISLSNIMKRGLENGTFWYSLALQSPGNGLHSIFYDHIQPRIIDENFNKHWFHSSIKRLWIKDIDGFIKRKLEDQQEYTKKLQSAFDVEPTIAESTDIPK